MSPEEVRVAVNSMLSDKIVMSWWQLGIVILLTGVAAYLGSYLKKKGENLATKEDIETLTRRVESVKTEYMKQLEDYKAALARRTNAVDVAELLAEFLYSTDSDKKTFMTKVWRLSLSLPPEIVMRLSSTLVEAKSGKADPKDLLVKVRKLIHGEDDKVEAKNLIHIE